MKNLFKFSSIEDGQLLLEVTLVPVLSWINIDIYTWLNKQFTILHYIFVTFGIQIRPDILWFLIWVQTVCIGYWQSDSLPLYFLPNCLNTNVTILGYLKELYH